MAVTRAVIIIDDIDVSIKRAAIFISIQKFGYRYLLILGQVRIVISFLEAYIMEVSNQDFILQDCMHQTFIAALVMVI